MGKLVICCDGTWNDPVDQTHISRIYDAARSVVSQPEICTYYDEGVGAEEPDDDDDVGRFRGFISNGIDSLAGGAFGTGISRNIREAYTWLVS